MISETVTLRDATFMDEQIADMTYPVRDWKKVTTHETVKVLAQSRREFWLAAAEGHLRLAEQGCTDALYDVREALALSNLYRMNR